MEQPSMRELLDTATELKARRWDAFEGKRDRVWRRMIRDQRIFLQDEVEFGVPDGYVRGEWNTPEGVFDAVLLDKNSTGGMELLKEKWARDAGLPAP